MPSLPSRQSPTPVTMSRPSLFPPALVHVHSPPSLPPQPLPFLIPYPYEISGDCVVFVQAESRRNRIKGCSRGCNDAGMWLLIGCCGAFFFFFFSRAVVKETVHSLPLLINSLSKRGKKRKQEEEEKEEEEDVSGGCGSHHLSPPLLFCRR